jgi:uncharacterized protein YndB with AHSA1/START domain
MDASLTITFTVEQSPEEVFAAITDVRAWWSGTIVGPTDALGAEFSYSVPDIHWSTFRITELEPGRRVAWLVTDSFLSFPEDKQEWTGTTVVFDIAERDGLTEVRFTHEGLRPQHECYDVCARAWGEYVSGSLRALITGGAGRPNSFEGPEALAAAQSGAAFG